MGSSGEKQRAVRWGSFQTVGTPPDSAPPWDPWVDLLLRTGRPLPPAARLAALAGDSLGAVGITLAITCRCCCPQRAAAFAPLAGGRRRRRGRHHRGAGGRVPSQVPLTQTLVPVAKPFPLGGWAGTAASIISWVGWGVLFACIPAAALGVILRFRSSRGVERQQMRWVAAGAATAVVGPLLLVPLEAFGVLPTVDSFAWPLLLAVPLAIGVAVLRYRLWDLDRLISRTVTYTAVTVLLVVPYLLVVPAASRLAEGSGSLAVAGATLAVAALFSPLRRRVQDLVDRRFNRRRYDAARTVDGFARRLRDQVDLDALHGELLGVVDQTMQPTQASLWLRRR
jgi:hypothetical protein